MVQRYYQGSGMGCEIKIYKFSQNNEINIMCVDLSITFLNKISDTNRDRSVSKNTILDPTVRF